MNFLDLNAIQQNVLTASIIGDGEITKRYAGSRRKNNSYREHFGINQKEYRDWKISFLSELLYMRPNDNVISSKSIPLFTDLFDHFYLGGSKKIPGELLQMCTLPHFLAVLYMDDGSLCINRRINHKRKSIYLTPQIYLYLQNYPLEQLEQLQLHINTTFNQNFRTSKRRDGCGYILRCTKVKETINFLKLIRPVTSSCPSMDYKTSWEWRLKYETQTLKTKFPGYEVHSSSSDRFVNYSDFEINRLKNLKQKGMTDREIADELKRSYWSIVYKLRELRNKGDL